MSDDETDRGAEDSPHGQIHSHRVDLSGGVQPPSIRHMRGSVLGSFVAIPPPFSTASGSMDRACGTAQLGIKAARQNASWSTVEEAKARSATEKDDTRGGSCRIATTTMQRGCSEHVLVTAATAADMRRQGPTAGGGGVGSGRWNKRNRNVEAVGWHVERHRLLPRSVCTKDASSRFRGKAVGGARGAAVAGWVARCCKSTAKNDNLAPAALHAAGSRREPCTCHAPLSTALHGTRRTPIPPLPPPHHLIWRLSCASLSVISYLPMGAVHLLQFTRSQRDDLDPLARSADRDQPGAVVRSWEQPAAPQRQQPRRTATAAHLRG